MNNLKSFGLFAKNIDGSVFQLGFPILRFCDVFFFDDASKGESIDPLAAIYFNYRKTSIYGGSNEIQKNIMTQMILGL